MSKDTGGSAFPHPALADENFRPRSGDESMTLRDWFAGQALATAYAQHEADPDKTATWAYQVADAMLAARGVTNKHE